MEHTSVKDILRGLLDAETVTDIVEQFVLSSTGKHLTDEHNAVALALLEELQKRLAGSVDQDKRLAIARDARAAWHKVMRQALNVASHGVHNPDLLACTFDTIGG